MVLKFKVETGEVIEQPTCGCKCLIEIKEGIAIVEMKSRCGRHKG